MKISRVLASFVAMALSVASAAVAGDYSSYYKNLPFDIRQPEAPAIPSRSVSIADFGAKADGVTLNTDAFAKAIESLASQGAAALSYPRVYGLQVPWYSNRA